MPGRTIAHFELLEELESKQERTAYKARDTRTGHLVVVHVLRETERLTPQRELRAAAALSHPNLLDIWDVGEFEEEGRLRPFFVTPFLDGVTLEELIRHAREPLSVERVGDIALQTCAGLQAAHDQALIHGHLTPGNILITDRGLVKIMNFGLPRGFLAEAISPYASPEQVLAGMMTAASDIFSLGVIAFEALTLRNPFAQPEHPVSTAVILQHNPPPVNKVNPAVSQAVSQVIQKAMAKDPAMRFMGARELAEALQSAIRNQFVEENEAAKRSFWIERAKMALGARDLADAQDIIHELSGLLSVDHEIEALRNQLHDAIQQKLIWEFLDRATAFVKHRNLWDARREIEEALRIDPENGDARRLRGEIERAVEEEKHVNRLREEQENLYRTAIHSYQQGDTDSALAMLEQVMDLIRQTPRAASEPQVLYQNFYSQLRAERESARAAYAEARRYVEEEDFRAALDICARQLARTPQDERLQALMREVQELQERRNRSTFLEEVTRQVELEPDLERRVAILTEAVRRYPAEPRFQESLTSMRERRDLVNSILAKVRQFEEHGQLSEALDQIEILRRVYPQAPRIDLEVNRIMQLRDQQARMEAKTRLSEQADREAASGDYNRALELLRAARGQFPDDPELARGMSTLERAAAEQARRTARTLPEEIPAPQPAPVLDHVHFTITAPSRSEAGGSFELYFWVHLDKQRKSVIGRAMLALGVTKPEEMVVKSEGPVPLPRGTVVSARVCIEGLSVDPCEKSVVWSGEAGCASFVVAVPPGATQRQYHGTVSIRVNSCEIARMDFLLRVAGKSGRVPAKLKRHATAFASYASEDRDAVLARVQGMQKVAPWLKVFLDVIDLRSGDLWEKKLCKSIRRSDIFYLFWCRHARASEWVDREWRYAYEKRGLGFIDPVPLEPPQHAPPPDELKTKHFNDLWTELNRKVHGS